MNTDSDNFFQSFNSMTDEITVIKMTDLQRLILGSDFFT